MKQKKRSLENELKQEMRMSTLKRGVLTTIAAAGVIAVAAVAPNALKVIDPVLKKYERQQQYRVRSAFSRLVQKGYIRIEKDSQASLTEKGKSLFDTISLTEYKIKKPKKWDKKWRVIIFDIPESRKRVRGYVRHMLTSAGLIRLQDSVWIYPYDCEAFVVLLKTEMKIGKDLLYLIVEKIENDTSLRTHFGLGS